MSFPQAVRSLGQGKQHPQGILPQPHESTIAPGFCPQLFSFTLLTDATGYLLSFPHSTQPVCPAFALTMGKFRLYDKFAQTLAHCLLGLQ